MNKIQVKGHIARSASPKSRLLRLLLLTAYFSLLTESALADCHWSDSPMFHLDLLTVQPGGGYAYADSGLFAVALYPVHRGFADSMDFRICINKCGDFDDDCCVNLADVSIFVGHWLETGCAGPDWCSWADIEKSGSIDFVDFALLAENWLTGCQD